MEYGFAKSKSTQCPVCPQLLQRLSFFSGNPVCNPKLCEEVQLTEFVDPFTQYVSPLPSDNVQKVVRLLLFHDASVIVLCPGDTTGVLALARGAGETWKNTPFVAEKPDLPVITRLHTDINMRLGRGEAIPAIMEYDGSNNIVDFGRGYPPILILN